MRILMLHEDIRDPEKGQGGGAESLLRDQTAGLRARGHTVAWWHGQPDIAQARADFQPDVCHVGTLHNFVGLEPVKYLQRARVPHVWALMDYYPFCGSRMLLVNGDQSCPAVEGTCAPCADRQPAWFLDLVNASYHVALNRYTADIYKRNGLRCDAVVPLGIDTDLFHPDPAVQALEISIYTSSAWAAWPTKGMHILREALRGAPYGAKCLTGMPRSRIAEELRKASVFVFPSCYEETWGLCLTEAMASGCACIASDVAGPKAQITDGETGLLVPKRDPKALRAAMDRLMEDAELRGTLSANARAWVEAEASLDAMAARWEAVYREVLGA